MKIPALTPEIGYGATALVDADRPPSHDELTRLFRETKLSKADPGQGIGKLKRMRAVIDHALANDRACRWPIGELSYQGRSRLPVH